MIRDREVGYDHSDLELEERFAAIDANGNGRIDMDEYLVFALRDAITRSGDQMWSLIDEWDEDKSGQISKLEFRHAIRKFGFNCRRRDIDALFDRMDAGDSPSEVG